MALLLMAGTATICPAQYSGSPKDAGDDPYETKDHLVAGLNYLSNNVYLGRKDTLVIPYYSPFLGYHFKSGFYVKGMMAYTTAGNLGGHIDLTTLEAGYDHSFGEHFNVGVNAEKFFYNKNSISVRANTTAGIGLDAQYSNDFVEPQAIFNVDFNKNSQDYVLGLAADHDFGLDDGKLHLIPTASANAGTQNYFDEYFVNRLTKKDKNNKVKHVVQNPSKINILDYEFNVKTTYRTGHWLFTFIPTYALPESPASILLPGKKLQSEHLSNGFYVELDICYRG